MRQLCNLAYAAQVEHLDADELRAFDGKLEVDPGGRPKNQSRGVSALMQTMAMPKTGE